MTEKEQNKTSKFLSLVLRHKPETIGLKLDSNGWANTEELLAKMNENGQSLSFEQLRIVVENNAKKRFIFTDDESKIRANQGHSISVDLALEEKQPPDILYHGTATKNLDSIKAKGLIKGQRHHVHLSADTETALKVGQRHGKPVLLTIKSAEVHKQGIKFYQSANGVWLTDFVDVEFIGFPE
ncbi:MAG: RNA 2'-phosphotransferase [Bacteroidetes bacterium]|nr:RNA 2'-phosphotransferase [Bacteroidota bacterium]